jgi:hypothetical protein
VRAPGAARKAGWGTRHRPPGQPAPQRPGRWAARWPSWQGIYILAENAQGSSSSTCTPRTSASSTSASRPNGTAGAALASQPLLIPATFAATPHRAGHRRGSAGHLAALGLEITPLSPDPGGARRARHAGAGRPGGAGPQRAGRAGRSTTRAAWCSARATKCWPPWPAMARCAPTASSPCRDERAAAPDGSDRAQRPVQPRPAHLAPAEPARARRAVPANWHSLACCRSPCPSCSLPGPPFICQRAIAPC